MYKSEISSMKQISSMATEHLDKWGEDNIKNLINDFKKNEENGKDGKKGKKEYFVGSAVMVVSAEKNHDADA